MNTYKTRFAVRDRVMIDEDASLIGFVTGIMIRDPAREPMYEVSWIQNGTVQQAMIDEYRISRSARL